MSAALIVAALVLFSGIAAAQSPSAPSTHVGTSALPTGPTGEIDLRNPPPSTIPSSPVLPLPPPTPPTARPRQLFTFRPAAVLTGDWTDNFTRSKDNPQQNLRSGLSPSLAVALDDPTFTGQASYTPLVFYDTQPSDIGVHHTLAAQLGWAMTPRVTLSATGVSVRTDDPARADRLGLRRGREEFTSTTGSFGADYVLPLLKVGGNYRWAAFESTDQTTTSHTIGASTTLTLARINFLTCGYEYLTTRTEAVSATTGAATVGTGGATGDSSTRGHQLTATLSREFSSQATAGVTTSYALRDNSGGSSGNSSFRRWSGSIFTNWSLPDKLLIQGNTGISHVSPSGGESRFLWTTSSRLSYTLGPAVIGLGIESGISETFAGGEDAGVVETRAADVSFSYRFTPLLSASATATQRENTFTGEDASNTTGREEKTMSLSVRASYQVLRWLVSTLDYSYTKTRSTEADRGFAENRVQATLSAIFY